MTRPETYQRAWERAHSLLERRQAASTLGLGVNTALLAAMAFVMRSDGLSLVQRLGVITLLTAAGLVACIHWAQALRSYQRLMSWWYDRLRLLEEGMDPADRLASDEHAALYRATDPRVRLSLTRSELALVTTIGALHLAFTALAAIFAAGLA